MSVSRSVVLVHRPTGASGVSMRDAGFSNGYQGANHYAVEIGSPGDIIRFDLTVLEDRETVKLRVIKNASRGGFAPVINPINADWDYFTGATTLSDDELIAIGNRLIDEHASAGKYSKLWNNCQIWAVMFIHEIANHRQHWILGAAVPVGYRIMRLFT